MPTTTQYPVKTAAEVVVRIADVAKSIIASPDERVDRNDPGLEVEVMHRDPYGITVGAVTAVGFKFGKVLLTVEPTEQPPSSNVDRLAQLIREVDGNHDLGAGALAQALHDRGVFAIRG